MTKLIETVEEALAYLLPHPDTNGPVVLKANQLRLAVDVLRADATEAKNRAALANELRENLSQENAAAWALLEKAGTSPEDGISDIQRGLELLLVVESFVADNGITEAPKSFSLKLYATAPKLIADLCEICGYADMSYESVQDDA